MEQKWMPITAGILDIVAGILSLFSLFFVFLGLAALKTTVGADMLPGVPANLIAAVIIAVGAFFICIDILAIVCGIYTLLRRKWWVALTGAIAAFLASWIIGIAAIVFTVMSKKEYD
jgi:uncharacterized membrane protein